MDCRLRMTVQKFCSDLHGTHRIEISVKCGVQTKIVHMNAEIEEMFQSSQLDFLNYITIIHRFWKTLLTMHQGLTELSLEDQKSALFLTFVAVLLTYTRTHRLGTEMVISH